jgi:beta-glucanase (GH16 family)
MIGQAWLLRLRGPIYHRLRGGLTMHRPRIQLLRVFGAVLFLALLRVPANAQTQWSLVWSDEFNGAANTAPDPNNWSYDSPAAGASNNELEIYCGQAGAGQTGDCANWLKNGYMDGAGNLVISAVLMPDGQWTSARILTHGHFTFTYGRAEARIKLPSAAGLWPAYWMLGDNIFSGTSWPNCGEEDMMENVPSLGPTVVQSSLNGPGYNGGSSIHAQYNFPVGERIDTDYHVYGLIWGPDLVQVLRG